MKQTFLLIACCLLNIMLFGQSEPKAFLDWQTTDGTQLFFHKNVSQTDGYGNVYVAGATKNINGTTDILIAKYNEEGDRLWVEQYNGTANFHDFATGLYLDGSGGVYITGTVCNDNVNFTTDLIVMKYDDQGVNQWTYTYDGGVGMHDAGKDIIVDGSGNVFVTGGSYNSSGNTDIITLSLDNTGAQLWVMLYDFASRLDDIGYRMEFKGSSVIVVGPVTNSTNDYRVVVLDYDAASGSFNGDDISSATSTSSVEIVSDMVTDANGNIYICGATEISGQGYDYFVAKLNSMLSVVWQQTYNGTNNLDDLAKGIKVDASGNVYVTGYSTTSTQGRNIVTIKYNSSGTQQWLQNYNGTQNGDDEGSAIVIDNSANLYITGTTASDINQQDYFTLKYNSSGTKLWDIQTDGHHLNDRATNLVLNINGDVIVTGESETAPNVFEYKTEQYVQKDIITPTDFSGESPSNNFRYYTNKGQLIKTNNTLASELKYYTYGTYPEFYFKDNSQSFVYSKIDTVRSTPDTLHRTDLLFTNSFESAKTYAMGQKRDGYLNYYLAHTGNEGVAVVFGNQRLITTGLYNNIDLMSSSNQNGIKYYFIVKPGGDPRDIKLDFNGATSYSLDGTTNALSINSVLGSLTFDRPIAYQLSSTNSTVAVTGWTPDWQTDGASDKYKFNTGSYTSSLTLIVEVAQKPVSVSSGTVAPTWSTFYGGGLGAAASHDIATDQNGNLYSTGYTNGTGFPTTTGPAYAGGYTDAFVTKFDVDYGLVYTTLFGGNDYDRGYGITFDKLNNKVYICGSSTGTTAPTQTLTGSTSSYTNNAFGYDKSFIARFNNLGAKEWSTKFGRSNFWANKIKADANGNIYVIGDFFESGSSSNYTTTCSANNSPAFPLCNPGGGAYYQFYSVSANFPNSSSFVYTDGYIARFNSQTALTWSTIFGGDGDDFMRGLYVDDVNQKLYVVGATQSLNNGTQNCAFTSTAFPLCNSISGTYYSDKLNGNNSTSNPDGFISRFNLNTLALEWSTYHGGNNEDEVTDVVSDNSGNIFVTGFTKSSTSGNNNCNVPSNGGFPLCTTGYTQNYNGGYDGFVSKFSSSGNLTWSTYFGGDASESVIADFNLPRIALNSINNNIYISGSTRSVVLFPSGSNGSLYQQPMHGDATAPTSPMPSDGFVAEFNNSGSLINSTYFGGKGSISDAYGPIGDVVRGLATYQHRVYVCGNSYSSSVFPFACPGTTNPYCITTYGAAGKNHLFYAQLAQVTAGVREDQNLQKINSALNVYPNPTNGNVNFEWNSLGSEKATISVYNMMGQLVNKNEVVENSGLNKKSLNLSDLKFGMYLVVIKTENQTLSAKFIKE